MIVGGGTLGQLTCGAMLLLSVAAHKEAHAQGVPVTGIVTDTAGKPVDSADVVIGELRLRTRTGADGKFALLNLSAGNYEIRVRKLGFLPQAQRVNAQAQVAPIRFSLVPVTHLLDPVVVSTSRSGITGFVGDSAFNALEGATISVVSANGRATTDSIGHFSIDIRPGSYLLQVAHEGFGARVASVTVPEDSGRRITILMSGPTKNQVRESISAFDQRLEMNRVSRQNARFYTRADIGKEGFDELYQIAMRGAPKPVGSRCSATVAGEDWPVPYWAIDVRDIEFAAVVFSPPTSRTSRAVMSCPMVSIWLRQ